VFPTSSAIKDTSLGMPVSKLLGSKFQADFAELVDAPTGSRSLFMPIISSLNLSGQTIATSAEVTLKCGLAGESSENQLNSGLGII